MIPIIPGVHTPAIMEVGMAEIMETDMDMEIPVFRPPYLSGPGIPAGGMIRMRVLITTTRGEATTTHICMDTIRWDTALNTSMDRPIRGAGPEAAGIARRRAGSGITI